MTTLRSLLILKLGCLFVLTISVFPSAVDTLDQHANLTSSEKEALNKLKVVVQKYLYMDYMKKESYLIRFLRAKNMNIEDAKNQIVKMVNWRKQNKIDTLLNKTLEIEKLMKYIITHDRIGQPASTIKITDWLFRRLILAGRAKELELGIYKLFEIGIDEMRKASIATGRSITKGIMIIDFSGFNLREHACLQCIPFYHELLTTYENYYPWILDKMILVNAPRSYEFILNAIKPVLSQQSRDSIYVFGFDKTEWRRYLLKFIADDQLPVVLGGTFGRHNKTEVQF